MKEIRLKIVDEVCDWNTSYWIVLPPFMRSGQKIPAICKVSSRLRDEVMPIWMANNTVKFCKVMYPYCHDIPVQQRSERFEKY